MHAILLFMFLSLTLVGHHLLNESLSSVGGKGEKRSSSSGIYVPLRHGLEPLVEILEHELVLHSVVRAGLDVILEPFPCLGDGF